MDHDARPAKIWRLAAAAALVLVLAGCQSTGTRLTAASSGPTLAAPPEATQPGLPPVPAALASFRFDQVLGVPTNQADTLAEAIGLYARERNLTLVRRGDPTATYRVLGYLSAVGGTGETNVVYVWDIVDANNRRLHRITGTEITAGGDADPWSGVTDAALANIAARTVEAIYAWVNQVPGDAAPPSAAAAAPVAGAAI